MTTDAAKTPPERDELDLLLPWYATDRLNPAERDRIDKALARDPELARRLALVDEEMGATIDAHEALPAPSAGVRQELFARIEALEGTGRDAEFPGGLLGRILGFFGSLPPRTTAMAAGFAALLIILQAGLLAGSLLRQDASFQVASHEGGTGEGSFALVTFAPAATASQMTELLDAQGARIVDGPYPGGIFRVQLSPRPLDGSGLEEALAKLRGRADVVLLALPADTR